MSEITCRDLHLIADALGGQARRVAARVRGKAYSGPDLASARAHLRVRSARLAWLAVEEAADRDGSAAPGQAALEVAAGDGAAWLDRAVWDGAAPAGATLPRDDLPRDLAADIGA